MSISPALLKEQLERWIRLLDDVDTHDGYATLQTHYVVTDEMKALLESLR